MFLCERQKFSLKLWRPLSDDTPVLSILLILGMIRDIISEFLKQNLCRSHHFDFNIPLLQAAFDSFTNHVAFVVE